MEAVKKGFLKDAGFALKPFVKENNNTTRGQYEKISNAFNHRDTAKLQALDIFTGNVDRHGENYFYDKKRDSFTGIDHGESYNFIPDFVGIRGSISKGLNGNYNKDQMNNLREFKSTLKDLSSKNRPEDIGYRMDSHYKAISKNVSKNEDRIVRANLQKKKEVVRRNYDEAQKLVNWLEENGV